MSKTWKLPRQKAQIAARGRQRYARDPRVRSQGANGVAIRRARRFGRVIGWADMEAILSLYSTARRLTDETGVRHEVDHIVALSDGGHHVLDNLQILSEVDHRQKTSFERGTYWLAPIPER